MKKLFFLLLLASPLMAQAQTSHKVTATWTNSADTPNTNVYRAPGSCAATVPASVPAGATLLTATPVTSGTYVDSTVSAGATYCYYVASTLNGSISAPLQGQAVIPLAGPSNLVLTPQ